MSNFKNIQELGLEVLEPGDWPGGFGSEFVSAVQLESLLSQGVLVYGRHAECVDPKTMKPSAKQWRMNQSEEFWPQNTHTALLINVRPIERDSLE